MGNTVVKKGLVIGITALFVGTGVITGMSGNISESGNVKKVQNEIITTLTADIHSTDNLSNGDIELQLASECLVWGCHNDVFVVDGIAYVANDLGLLLIDVHEPSRPRLLGKYLSDDFQNWHAEIVGPYAYLTNRYNGMDIIDVSVPNDPVFLGNWGHGLISSSYSVCVQDSVAYLASPIYGLVIIDVGNPVTPTLITTYPFNCSDVVVRDDLAFVVDGGKLLILDVLNPANPESVAACETPGSARRLCLSGDHVYVADGDAGLTIVDVSSPYLPEVSGWVTTYDFGWDVWTVGRYAYVADRDAGLTIVDVDDSEHPTVVGNCATPGEDIHFQGVFADSSHAYLADDNAGLELIDITVPTDPVQVGSFSTTGFNGATEVALHASYAYLIDRSDGLKILDISEALAPQLVGVFEDDRSRGISLVHPYAYVASEDIDLMVIDVSDPASPSLTGTYDTPIGAQDVHTVDTIAYLVAGNQLFVVNVTNPYDPSLMGSVELYTDIHPRIVRDVYVEGSYAYIACSDTAEIFSGATIVDVSVPYAPQVAGEYAVDYFAFSVYVHQSKAYIGEGMICEPDAPGRLEIIDVADPEHPFYLGEYNIPDGIVMGIYVDSVAYLASGAAGIKVLDVSVPNNPELICEYNTPGVACGLSVNIPYLYVGDHNSFIILTTQANDPPEAPTITGPTQGEAGVEYEFTFVSTDPEDDDLYYYIDWGDETSSGWLGPYDSGDTCYALHAWTKGGTYNVRARARDIWGNVSNWSESLYMNVSAICGDCNNDGIVDLTDVLYLISYLYKGGPPPDPLEVGDVDCSGEIELGDVLYLINYLYKGGPSPGCG